MKFASNYYFFTSANKHKRLGCGGGTPTSFLVTPVSGVLQEGYRGFVGQNQPPRSWDYGVLFSSRKLILIEKFCNEFQI